jgi:cellulose synthase/poly-beta-1,6-N-acetylglucosamine synthase-like glycosyltransferase
VGVIEVLFWVCVLLVLHTYLVYPLLLLIASSAVQAWRDLRYLRSRQERRRAPREPLLLPAVSLIIPAHNEERYLPGKLQNLAALDYPPDRLQVIFISDGSTDSTNAILRSVESDILQVVYLPTRGGKAAALNQAVAGSRHEIIVFSDAATLFARDAVKKLVRHFADPQVGVVCGALQFQGSAESCQTEGVYWGYESMIRLMESRLGVTLSGSGAIYALRRQCFVPLAADTLVEDLVVPMNARALGFRVLYDPEARATDFAASTVAGEFTRRVRIATGSFQVLGQLLRAPLDARTKFAFLSHKVLRWLIPFLLIGMLVSSASLWPQPLYRALFVGQLLFYAWGVLGYVLRARVQRVRYVLLGYYLVAIHLAFLVGFVHFLLRHNEAGWRRVS